jgi:hypothetical protein
MKAKAWLMAVVMCLFPVVSNASTKWYIFEAQNDTCISGQRAVAMTGNIFLMTPLRLRDYLRIRHSETYDGYKIYHFGSQLGVALKNGSRYFYYFTTKALCEKYAVKPTHTKGQGLSDLR